MITRPNKIPAHIRHPLGAESTLGATADANIPNALDNKIKFVQPHKSGPLYLGNLCADPQD